MPRFFFHMLDRTLTISDHEGTELPDLETAVAEAAGSARWLISEDLRTGKANLDRRFEIVDEAGQVLATILFRSLL